MKKFALFALLLIHFCQTYAQSMDIVKEFGETLSRWTVNYDFNDRVHLERLCDKGFRISDDISDRIIDAPKKKTTSLMLDTYLNWFEFVNEGKLSISVYDYEQLDKKSLKCESKNAKERVNDQSREYLSCKIRVDGLQSYEESALICVRNNKMFGITKLRKKGKRIVLK